MFQRHSLVFICLLIACQSTFGQDRTINFGELESTINEELKATNIPGAVFAGDRVVFAKGFGVAGIQAGTPVTFDTPFRIASTSKMLTAAALVNFAEQRKIKRTI